MTPINLNGSSNYGISVREYDFGGTELPGLHSFAAGVVDGKWVLLSGRTNGVHGLDQSGMDSFPPESENRDVWVIDPVAKQAWHRALGDRTAGVTDPNSGLDPGQIASLTTTNSQYEQIGDTLYISGGYGLATNDEFVTFDKFTAINLPGLANWVVTGAGRAVDSIRQIDNSIASVTGGAMYELNGRMQIVFGQDFEGNYSPRADGTYTRQVRSFEVYDNGTYLAINNPAQTAQLPEYRRRDLNVYPTVRPDGMGGTTEGLVALSGVFTSSFGAWTVPVVIDANGQPSMADPNEASTFKQGFNGYHSAKLGLYSESSERMDEVLFGGISLQDVDPQTQQIVTDDDLPFVNDITVVSMDAADGFSQSHLGYFPAISDAQGKLWRFGANAEFFPAEGIETFANGVIKADALHGATVLGYIFGGITANGPHTRGVPDVVSTASYRVFEVVYTPVPEPSSPVVALIGIGFVIPRRLPRRALFVNDSPLLKSTPLNQAA